MSALKLPPLAAKPARLRRSGLRWLCESGAALQAREPLASCYVRMQAPAGARMPLAEEQNDIQVVLAPRQAGIVQHRGGLGHGGFRDLVEAGEWRAGEVIADADREDNALDALVLAGRRGFESGEGRGSLLAGWHDKVRGAWEGPGGATWGQVLSLGTCEQNAVFRGEDMAFLSWFARAPGPVQFSWVGDERCVHSAAVLLQHVRRTPVEAAAITAAVIDWINERTRSLDTAAFPGFQPGAARGVLAGRWPEAQALSYAFHLMTEAVGTSPILECTELPASGGIIELPPPQVVALTLGSEVAPHFRHRKTGWIIAMHGFRFGPYIGEAVADWLRRDFEPLPRSVDDIRRDLAALADEVHARTGATLLVQNLVASSAADRVSNYAWLGDECDKVLPVMANEANLMLRDLTRSHAIALVDSDAIAAELGVDEVPDRFHASQRMVEMQRDDVHGFLRDAAIPGF